MDGEVIKPADESTLRAFLLLLVFVPIALGFWIVIAGLFGDRLPLPARKVIDPTGTAESRAAGPRT